MLICLLTAFCQPLGWGPAIASSAWAGQAPSAGIVMTMNTEVLEECHHEGPAPQQGALHLVLEEAQLQLAQLSWLCDLVIGKKQGETGNWTC